MIPGPTANIRPFDPSRPVRVVLVGAVGMGRQWLRTLEASPDVELVGFVDDRNRARARAPLRAHVLDLAARVTGTHGD
ncbi:hypothetical protein ELQ92_15900 [Labedella populi]|uniref:Uncharacterized protein n=1 Tax=Labedella populi TaxID=2498850 RepID=A0A444Q1J9_9MICO|nr:hypothetical protein ELQ92_15900 [Labedella populi]